MNSSSIFFVVALLIISSSLLEANKKFRKIDENNSIDDQYILIFKDGITETEKAAHFEELSRQFAADSFSNEIITSWNIKDFNAFSAKLSQKMLKVELKSDDIALIEQDAKITVSQTCQTQNGAVWGLDRISENALNLDLKYKYTSTSGEGVDSYVVDTGININHEDFGGRAIWGANFADSKNTDCNGHGTHVAGTMGSATYGVAKKTTLFAVKVLDCSGSGTNTGVISGVNWVVTTYNSRKRPSVANMSLGGGKSVALDTAVKNAISAGVTFVVAAGNENNDACLGSPSNVPTAITVGATGTTAQGAKQVDNRATFSNYGKCVSIFAPGSLIESTWIGTGNDEVEVISGTSMASPHAAGVVALYLGENGSATPAQVKSWMVNTAGENYLNLVCSGAISSSSCNQSPNLLLYSPCSM
jgi:subtilisin family serine protease